MTFGRASVVTLACVLLLACGGDDGSGGDDVDAPDAEPVDNATLASLTTSVGTLDPPFEPEVAEYDVHLSPAEVAIGFTPTAAVTDGTTITVDAAEVASGTASSPRALLLGIQDVDIVVTAAGGATTTYRVHVHRGEPGFALSFQGSELAGLLGPAFDPATTTYTVDTGLWLPRLQVTVIPPVAGSTITVAAGPVTAGEPSSVITLNLGLTPIAVVITPPGGAATTYVIDVTRGATVTQRAYAKASNTSSYDFFGGSVGLWGDTMVVGARGEDSSATGVGGNQADNSAADSGAVYVFTRTGSTWSQQAYLKASNAELADNFGATVAIWGDTIAVGAPGEASGAPGNPADNTADDAGAVYVFTRTGTTWTQQAYVKASNVDEYDSFGGVISLWDDTLAVGAVSEDGAATGVGGNEADDSADSSGAAYVFTRTGATWTQQAYVKASNTGFSDAFGCAIAVHGDTLAVGARSEGSAATGVGGNQANDDASESGAVYVYTRTGETWAQQAYVKASNTDAGDWFGFAVALSSDKLAVGAPQEDSATMNPADDSASDSGAAYVFERAGTEWTQEDYLKAGNVGADDLFGYRISLWNNGLAISAREEDSAVTGVTTPGTDNTADGAGAVYVFVQQLYWTATSYVKASNTGAGDWFGHAVSMWGDTVAIGATNEDSAATGVGGNQANEAGGESGAVYVYR